MKRHALSTISIAAAAIAVLLVGSSAPAPGAAISVQFFVPENGSPRPDAAMCYVPSCMAYCSCPWNSKVCCLDGARPLGTNETTGAPQVQDPAFWNLAEGSNSGGLF